MSSDTRTPASSPSRHGQLARVFLGSTATKILRHTPVPGLVIPSGTTTWS